MVERVSLFSIEAFSSHICMCSESPLSVRAPPRYSAHSSYCRHIICLSRTAVRKASAESKRCWGCLKGIFHPQTHFGSFPCELGHHRHGFQFSNCLVEDFSMKCLYGLRLQQFPEQLSVTASKNTTEYCDMLRKLDILWKNDRSLRG